MQCDHVYPSHGQCEKPAVLGTRCYRHASDDDKKNETALYAGLRAQYKQRIVGLKGHDEMRTLANEIALARMLIEERFNQIESPADLIAATQPLNSLLLTVEKLVGSCHKLEHSLGSLLEKPAMLKIASDIVQIVLEELPANCDKTFITDRIGQRIIEVIADTRNIE